MTRCDPKIVCLVLAASAAGMLQADLIIAGYSELANDRFTNSGSFVLAGRDLSAIGQAEGGKFATAIGRNVVISANHFRPTGTLRFFPGNDASAAASERRIVSGVRVPGTDLYLGVLDANLPGFVTPMPFATESLTGNFSGVFSAGVYQNRLVYVVGRSPKANPGFQDQAVGQNALRGFSGNVPAFNQPDVDVLVTQDDVGRQAVPFEATLAEGDSGGPLLVDIDGELRLIGVNAFTFGSGVFSGVGSGSGMSYTGNQAAYIAGFIQNNRCDADFTTTSTNPGDPGYADPDGTVDGADLSYYVERWLGGVDPVTDLTTTSTNPGQAGYGSADGSIDGADLSYFVEAWLAGCS